MKCPSCQTELVDNSSFCDICGHKMQQASTTNNCPKCGFENMQGSSFCDNCGFQLSSGQVQSQKAKVVLIPPVSIPSTPSMGNITCPGCNTVNPAGTMFCDNCGKNISQVVTSPSINCKVLLEDGNDVDIILGNSFGRSQLGQYLSDEQSKWVSREHFKIFHRGGEFYILDEGSTNGTKLNGVDITRKGEKEIKTGDIILLADALKLTFRV